MPMHNAMPSRDADVQPYKYNGKEFDHMHGLNTYDYGARQHDPILARWDRIDPLCEKYYSTSPYAYCANNPVNANDPDGRAINWLLGGAIGAGVELASQLIEQYDGDMSVMDNLSKNVNWTNVAIAAGEGALTSGVSALKGVGAKVAVSAISSATKEVSQQIKEGAKSYKDINLQKVGKNPVLLLLVQLENLQRQEPTSSSKEPKQLPKMLLNIKEQDRKGIQNPRNAEQTGTYENRRKNIQTK